MPLDLRIDQVILKDSELLAAEQRTCQMRNIWDKSLYELDPKFENHLRGMLGEHAVAKFLKIPIDNRILENGDGGVDLVYGDKTLQVKTVKSDKYNLWISKNKG